MAPIEFKTHPHPLTSTPQLFSTDSSQSSPIHSNSWLLTSCIEPISELAATFCVEQSRTTKEMGIAIASGSTRPRITNREAGQRQYSFCSCNAPCITVPREGILPDIAKLSNLWHLQASCMNYIIDRCIVSNSKSSRFFCIANINKSNIYINVYSSHVVCKLDSSILLYIDSINHITSQSAAAPTWAPGNSREQSINQLFPHVVPAQRGLREIQSASLHHMFYFYTTIEMRTPSEKYYKNTNAIQETISTLSTHAKTYKPAKKK